MALGGVQRGARVGTADGVLGELPGQPVVGTLSCSWKQAYLPACRCSSGHCRSLFITFSKPQPLIPVPATAEEGPGGSLETFSDCLWGYVIWC